MSVPETTLPNPLAAAFQRHALESGRAAWVTFGADQRVLESGGELEHFRLAAVPGASLARRDDPIDVLDALVEAHDAYEVLPRVELGPGFAADVHRGRLGDGVTFLLLFDVSADASSETLLRQRGLDLGRLLRDLGSDASQRSRLGGGWAEALAASGAGPHERDRVTSLCVRVVDAASGGGDATERLALRERRLVAVIEPLLERTGMAEVQGCDAVRSWCGLVLGARDPAERALEVAVALRDRVPTAGDALDRARGGIAIGLATGPAIVGALSLPGGPRLAVLADCAQRAATLASRAGAGDVLLDAATASAAGAARVLVEPEAGVSLDFPVHRAS